MKKSQKKKIIAYGFDGGTTRDVGVLFLEECSKTLSNGTCPGHHNHVVIVKSEKDDESNWSGHLEHDDNE